MQCWLEDCGLGHYYETFLMNEITNLQSASRLQFSEALFDHLEMHIPAHRKRLKKAGEGWSNDTRERKRFQ